MELSDKRQNEVLKQVQKESPLHVKLTSLIEVKLKKGDGTPNNPIRIVNQYWSVDGIFIAESTNNDNSSFSGSPEDV